MDNDLTYIPRNVRVKNTLYDHLYQHGSRAITRLFNTPPHLVSQLEMAEMNLICAYGLPNTENLDISALLAQLDSWADYVKKFTQKSLKTFDYGQTGFQSLAEFKIGAMIHVITRKFDVRYNSERLADPDNFQDPADSFIHGILRPSRSGTCASLPVLFTSIGRRLNYPLKLVEAPGHLFYRWDTPQEKFNIEFHADGLNITTDDHYKTWPVPWNESVIQQEKRRPSFLISLTPQKELALFASMRAHVLAANNIRLTEAAHTMQIAYKLDPRYSYGLWLNHMITKARNPGQTFAKLPCEQTVGCDILQTAASQGILQNGKMNKPPY